MPEAARIYDSENQVIGPDNPLEIEFANQSIAISAISLPSTIRNGKVTVTTAGTRVQLSGSSVPLTRGVSVKAAIGNANTIYLGNASVSASNGFELSAGQEEFIECSDLNLVYIDAAANTQSVTYIGT